MELVIYVALGTFGVFGLFLIVINYRSIIKDIWRRTRAYKNTAVSSMDSVERELTILNGPLGAASKASAFVRLMKLGYVRIHMMVSRGDNYIDEVQSKRFQESLTQDLIMRLNTLEGTYDTKD